MKKTLLVAPAVAYLLYRLNAKTSTKKNEGENAISELKMVPVNDTELAVMIAGTDKDNPVLLCVTGGPAGSEIPFIRRHEKELEKHFTIVHYDQRGAGKSYSFKEDYKDINYHQHVADLIALTEYVRETNGVQDVTDVRFSMEGHRFSWECTVLTEYGSASVSFAI